MNLSAYVGMPYQDRGCWELLRRVYAEQLSIELPSYADEYLNAADQHDLARLIREKRTQWLRVDAEQPGDGVLLNILGEPTHIGIVAEPGSMLHVVRNCTSVIESYRSPKWARRIEGFYRWN